MEPPHWSELPTAEDVGDGDSGVQAKPASVIRFEGHVHKRGRINPAFQPRFFVLTDDELRYYRTQGTTEDTTQHDARGRMQCNHIAAVQASPASVPGAFEFTVTDIDGRSLVCSVPTEESRQAWIQQILAARSRLGLEMEPDAEDPSEVVVETMSSTSETEAPAALACPPPHSPSLPAQPTKQPDSAGANFVSIAPGGIAPGQGQTDKMPNGAKEVQQVPPGDNVDRRAARTKAKLSVSGDSGDQRRERSQFVDNDTFVSQMTMLVNLISNVSDTVNTLSSKVDRLDERMQKLERARGGEMELRSENAE